MYVTIFYSKNTGLIKTYCITETPQDMSYFGENKVDYEIIYDFLIFEYNEHMDVIIKNRNLFNIDLETKQIIQKEFNLQNVKETQILL